MCSKIFLSLLLLTLSTGVQAAVITFNGTAGDGEYTQFVERLEDADPYGNVLVAPYSEAGFEVSIDRGALWFFDNDYSTFATELAPFDDDVLRFGRLAEVTLTEAGGGVFNLLGFDVGSVFSDGELTFTGYFADGSSISQSVVAGYGESSNIVLSGFTGITSLNVKDTGSTGGPLLDNLSLVAVPIPAAIWLFGSALAGLGWMRRKQTT